MNSKRRTLILAVAAAGLSSALSGCGFKLRGSAELPFRTLYLNVAESSGLGTELRRNLRSSSNVRLVTDAKEAQAQFQLLNEAREKEVLSVNSDGRAREYTLRYRISFRLHDGKGRDLIAPTEVALKRDITFNEDARLAKESEEALLYRDMQTDMVQQILRRLSALPPL